jgi:HTH-type transcriptional regulator/antitoxin HigA
MNKFNPDWNSHVGETIEDIIEERGIKVKELAFLLGLDLPTTELLLNGNLPIDYNLAVKLSLTLGSTPSFWLQRSKL